MTEAREAAAEPTEPPAALPLLDMHEMRSTGVLWAINRYLFHPRGYALALTFAEDGSYEGWQLLGDGTDVWSFAEDEQEDMERFEAFLNSHRPPLYIVIPGTLSEEDAEEIRRRFASKSGRHNATYVVEADAARMMFNEH